MKKNKQYINYQDALTDNEILQYALIINDFKNEKIDYVKLKKIFEDHGVFIEPIIKDFSHSMITNDVAIANYERFLEKKYLYQDIQSFILYSEDYENVIFKMDYKVNELLASHGLKEYQEACISAYESIIKNTFNDNEKSNIIKNKYKRRILELKKSLDNINVVNMDVMAVPGPTIIFKEKLESTRKEDLDFIEKTSKEFIDNNIEKDKVRKLTKK